MTPNLPTLTNFEKIQAIQSVLGLTQSGNKDAETDAAYEALGEADTRLPSRLPWTGYIDGADIVVRNVKATCFGGRFDKGDDGQTESGTKNDGSTNLMQCALPIRSTEAATKDSPLAFKGEHIRWMTHVKVWQESKGEDFAIMCVLTDNGPDVSKFPDHALDLNPPAALHFATNEKPESIANDWTGEGFSYRIVGAAKYVS